MRTSIDASANPLAISCASSGVEASAVTVTMFDWATGWRSPSRAAPSGLRGESMSCLTRWATSMLVIRRLAVSTSRVGIATSPRQVDQVLLCRRGREDYQVGLGLVDLVRGGDVGDRCPGRQHDHRDDHPDPLAQRLHVARQPVCCGGGCSQLRRGAGRSGRFSSSAEFLQSDQSAPAGVARGPNLAATAAAVRTGRSVGWCADRRLSARRPARRGAPMGRVPFIDELAVGR